MTARHETTELQRYINGLYDQIRGPLGNTMVADPEAADMARAEISVIFEVLREEAERILAQSRARDRNALYGPGSNGRILAALGVPLDHRAWKRLDAVQSRAKEQSDSRYINATGGQS